MWWWLWARAIAYMLLVGGVHFVALPWLLLSIEAGSFVAAPHVRAGASAGVLLIVSGGGLAITAAAYLVVAGRGTPFPLDSTTALVRRGPYRYIRNPQAVAATTIVLGECLVLESGLIWLLLPATILYLEALARPIEDWQLRRKFGAEYLAYRETVPRWIPFSGIG